MDSDQGKLFIGGISWETTEDRLKEYFNKYGDVLQAVIMKDKVTGRPRGFGFVVFADPDVLDRVLQEKHAIDGRTVEAKRALSREEQHTSSRSGNFTGGKGMGGGGGGGGSVGVRTKKIFVGGLPPTLSEDGFRQYFETYGSVTDVVIMYDQSTQRPRGFGFITFDTEDAVDHVLHKNFHELNGKFVEVKRALPKDANPSSGGGGGGRSSGGGSYQSYGSSNTSAGSYDGRMDSNRYMQTPAVGGAYPGYGAPSFSASGYGYGTAGNGVSYGGYGVGAYGGPAAGYGGPAAAYGNPNAAAGGYGTGPPGAPRSPWNSQAPSSYGSAGYGSAAGYGAATGTWNASGGGGNAGPTAQPPSAAGYGNQGYGYGSYGGADGSYGSQGGYGSAGGRGGISGSAGAAAGGGGDQGSGAGYVGGGYNDAYGGSGYANSWRSDPSQVGGSGTAQTNGPPGGSASYGGYGGPQSRQAQQ